MKKYLLILLIVVLVGAGGFYWFFLRQTKSPTSSPSGVDNQATQAKKTNSNPGVKTTTGAPAADQKSGTTTKTGKITEAGGKFFLTEMGQTPKAIDSYEVSLGDYVGQTVTVVGQYSGDTLFVGSVK